MIVLSNSDIAALLPMNEAIDCVAKAMIEVSLGQVEMPLRSIMDVGGPNRLGMMPGSMSNPAGYGIKLVSLFPGNPEAGYSSHQGAMVLFEPKHGGAIAVMNAGMLTAVRTAAASAVATRELARAEASVVAVIGAGEQAEHHLEAMAAVRPVAEVRIAGRDSRKVAAFVEKARSRFPELEIQGGIDAATAVDGADIVCTVTAASDPILSGNMISSGTHLNVVGASIPSKREIDTDLVLRSSVFVDYRKSTFAQAGEVIAAIEEGAISKRHIRGEIGEVLAGAVNGRSGEDEVTLYRSLGVAAQDLACAHHVVQQARRQGLGVEAAMD